MNSRTYQVGNSKITLLFGDIRASQADVLVSSDDYMLTMGGGVSAALRQSGGHQVAADVAKMVPARPGDVVVSTSGDLEARYIFHAVTIGPRDLDVSSQTIVRQATQRALHLLSLLGCRSIAFPAIGAGVARIPYETVAAEMASTLVDFLLDNEGTFDVQLYLMDRGGMDRDDLFIFFEAFAAKTFGLTASRDPGRRALEPPPAAESTMEPHEQAEAERRRQVYLMLRHLDARRNGIEQGILQALASESSDTETPLSQLREQLEEIQALRRNYESELVSSDKEAERFVPNSVFVSSTSIDLKEHRQAARTVIQKLQLKFIGMEEFAATAQAPADLIRQKVNHSQVYLGMLGLRYGFVDPGTGLSMTELEYRQAIASDKRICMFVMDKNAPILASMVEDDSTRFAKLLDFRSRVMKAHTCALFTDPQDLAEKAESTLKQTLDIASQ